jgi:hypothetical protein
MEAISLIRSKLNMNRRHFIAASTMASLGAGRLSQGEDRDVGKPVSFFLVGDTHYCSDETDGTRMNQASAETCGRLVDWLNRLPGTERPETAGGGMVALPDGVIHAGDLIENGDKGARFYPRAETEMAAFTADWGLNGGDGRLRWPVREIHGNHDSPHGDGPVIPAIIARNRRRAGLTRTSANGLHYSWDWGGVHFIALGIVAGDAPAVSRKRRYAPLGSLPFLAEDLAATPMDRPLVLVHHVDPGRYAKVRTDEEARKGEWDYGDVQAFYDLIKPRRVAATLYGHTHVRNIFRWDGSPDARATTGVPAINTDNASHWKSATQALCHLEIDGQELRVREFATKDAWLTGAWTPQIWRFPLPPQQA